MQNLRVAVDVGGTFTDICIMDETTGLIRIEKTARRPDPIDGIMAGIAKAGVDLRNVALFSHGTTVATNALITRRLPRTAMVCTKGFRDVIEIRRANKEDLWDAYKDVAQPYVPRRDRLTVAERDRRRRRGRHAARRGRGAARSPASSSAAASPRSLSAS